MKPANVSDPIGRGIESDVSFHTGEETLWHNNKRVVFSGAIFYTKQATATVLPASVSLP